jgi:Fur family ferric uptake transcriptional regulator
MSSLNDVILNLRDIYTNNGYKFTPQREIVITELLKTKKRHLSCQEIYNMVKEKRPSIGLSTVYRTVAILADIGILKEAFIDEDAMKYEMCIEYNHFHLVCKKCGAVIEVKDNSLNKFSKEIYKNYSFNITSSGHTFYGLCSDCSE